MVQQGEEVSLVRQLLERGLLVLLAPQDCSCVGGELLLNGLLGVAEANQSLPDGRPVLRLIMNLTASNAVQADWPGDIHMLPHFGQ